jgi:hypothetical protein
MRPLTVFSVHTWLLSGQQHQNISVSTGSSRDPAPGTGESVQVGMSCHSMHSLQQPLGPAGPPQEA